MESMCERRVHITTKYGNVLSDFLTGVPQGSTLSVHIANLSMWMKHKFMQADWDDPTEKRSNLYNFKIWDRGRDGRQDD